MYRELATIQEPKKIKQRNKNMDALLKVIVGIFGVALFLAVWAGVMSIFAWVVENLWNYIVCEMHHPELQMTFWVAFAVFFLCSILFKSSSSSSSKK